MNNSVVHSHHAPEAIGPYSQARQAGNFVFLSGQLPIDPESGAIPPDIENQTRQCLRNINAILTAAGLTLAHVVNNTIYLVDMDCFAAMNDVYKEYFPDCPPARSTIQVTAVPKGALIEIESVAFAEPLSTVSDNT